MSFIITFGMSFPANAEILSSSKVLETIDKELQTILQDSASNEKIPVDIWLYETSTQQDREQAIYSKIGMNKASITATKGNVSAKDVDTYIATERSLYAAERTEQYADLKRIYASVESLQETRKTNTRLFYSQYAPMISAELTRAEIKTLAYNSCVQSIEYSPNTMLENESNFSFTTIGADYTRDTLDYTGSGIKIGLLEAGGLPDKDLPYFDEDKIFYDPNVNQQTVDYHAEQVAAIMVAQSKTINDITYKGIVPDAQLYATYANTTDELRSRTEWLLSQGVHVINMSAGADVENSNTYGSDEKWFDHIAFNHSVHFVKSAGNNNSNITSPGMAYNILTVGAINDNDSTEYEDDSRYYQQYGNITRGSSYIEAEGLTNKPDLVAPGVDITDATGTKTGTSIAAPHVTAVVAQLCQRKPELKLLQDAVKAILTASVSHSDIRYNTMDGDAMRNQVNDNYNQCGAGVVNARSACSTIINSRYASGSFAANSGDGTQVKYTFEVTNTNRNVRVALSWLKCSVFAEGEDHESGDLTTGTLADLNLYIYDSEGKVVYQSKDVESNKRYVNTEIVEFKPTRTGTHRIYVRQSTQSNKRVYYGVAWWHPKRPALVRVRVFFYGGVSPVVSVSPLLSVVVAWVGTVVTVPSVAEVVASVVVGGRVAVVVVVVVVPVTTITVLSGGA